MVKAILKGCVWRACLDEGKVFEGGRPEGRSSLCKPRRRWSKQTQPCKGRADRGDQSLMPQLREAGPWPRGHNLMTVIRLACLLKIRLESIHTLTSGAAPHPHGLPLQSAGVIAAFRRWRMGRGQWWRGRISTQTISTRLLSLGGQAQSARQSTVFVTFSVIIPPDGYAT